MLDVSRFKGRKHWKGKGSLIRGTKEQQGLVAADQGQPKLERSHIFLNNVYGSSLDKWQSGVDLPCPKVFISRTGAFLGRGRQEADELTESEVI